MKSHRNILSIIKCVGDSCNLSCSYCFYRGMSQSSSTLEIMNDKILSRFTEDIFNLNQEHCTFIWHGGEPLLAGIEFFRKALAVQEKFNVHRNSVSNRIQTNGLLLDDEWIDFFIKNKFVVGISIDGPKEVNDKYRKDINGYGHFNKIMENMVVAKNRGLSISAICVVTSWSAKYPKEIYQFFVSNGIKKISFNPAFELFPSGKICDLAVSDEEYSYFLSVILELWAADDDPEIIIRQIQEPLKGLLHGRTSVCNYSGKCAQNIAVLPNGNITSCHDAYIERPVVFGNLCDQPLKEILEGPDYIRYSYNLLNQLPLGCKECSWYTICHGGCTKHRDYVTNSNHLKEYAYCKSRKKIFTSLEEKISSYYQNKEPSCVTRSNFPI